MLHQRLVKKYPSIVIPSLPAKDKPKANCEGIRILSQITGQISMFGGGKGHTKASARHNLIFLFLIAK